MKKITVIILFFVFCNSFAQENIKELRILHWNDFHARNEAYKVNKKIDGETKSIMVGGTASMLGYVNKFRDEKSLVLNGGDDYQGTPISSITRGYSQIELLNLYNLDAFVVGNHEFDYGSWVLDSALTTANFNVLSGNLFLKSKNQTIGKTFIVKEINGIKTGVLGISPTDLKTLTLPKNVSDVIVTNTDSVISAGISELKKAGCNLIILLSHSGADADSVYAEKFHGDIDIIIGGHSHTPIFKPRNVKGTLLCQAGAYGRYLGVLDIKVDTDKDTVIYSFGKLNETVQDPSITDAAADEKVKAMIKSIEPEMKRVIGKLETDWKKDNCGQWVCDAIREETKSDIGFLNAGSIRKDLLKGDITVGDIWEINPFGNNIVTFSISGATLKKMIANNIRLAMKDETLDYYDMIILSGVNVTFDSKKMSDSNNDFITSITVNGKEISDSKDYKVATNSYTASQANKYFGDFGTELLIEDTNIIDRDLVLDAIQKQKVINSVFEKRVIDTAKKNN